MAKMEQLQEVWPDSATNPYATTPPVIFGGHPPALGVSFRGRSMCQVPAVAAFAIALLPAAALAQVEPVSGPVSADDLTPYAGTYTIVAPGVAKANYLAVLEGFLEADGDPIGGVGPIPPALDRQTAGSGPGARPRPLAARHRAGDGRQRGHLRAQPVERHQAE